MKTLIVAPSAPNAPLQLRQVPDSALLTGGRPLFLRNEGEDVALSVMAAVRVCRLGLGVSERFAPRYYDAITLVALNLGAPGRPGPLADADLVADNALITGTWMPVPDGPLAVGTPLGHTEQWPDLRPAFDRAVSDVSRRSTLKTGDIIVLASPSTALTASADSRPAWTLNDSTVLNFKIK